MKNKIECCKTKFLFTANSNLDPNKCVKMGDSKEVTPNTKKLIAPVALPFTLSGLTSLIVEYGNIAAPDPTPIKNKLTPAPIKLGKNAN